MWTCGNAINAGDRKPYNRFASSCKLDRGEEKSTEIVQYYIVIVMHVYS